MAEEELLSKEQRKDLMRRLAEIGGGQFSAEDDIVQEGNRLILPENMSVKQAVKFLSERLVADSQTTVYHHLYRYRPWDGAVCTWRAMKRIFGMVGLSGQSRSFLGMTFDEPPEMRDIPIGPDEVVSVPWGQFTLPGFDDCTITTDDAVDRELGPLFMLHIEAPRKRRAEVQGIFALVQEELETNSIYRGRAFDGQTMPEFLDLSGIDTDKIVYAPDTLIQLEANIWSVMRHRQALADADITRKRAVLLHGPYGTGKTVGGFLTAKVAVESDWTFLYARPGRDNIEDVMKTARLYQPACVFVEDLDTVADPESAKQDTSTRLLDLFDGITAKGTEIMVVLTTNHPDRIHKGMLRPGRLDAVIEIGKLDEAGVTKLIKGSLPDDALARDIDWGSVYVANEDFLPAYVKEAADRAFRYALSRTGSALDVVLTTDDLVQAANGLRPQLDLMNAAMEKPKVDTLYEGIKSAALDAVEQHHAELYS